MNKPLNPQLLLLEAEPLVKAADAPALVNDNAEFDWDTDDSVIVPPRRGVAVYLNRFDVVVIRTQSHDGGEDDFAFVDRQSVPAVARAIIAAAKEGGAP